MTRSNLWRTIGCFLAICSFFLTLEKPVNAEQYAILIGIWDYHNKNLELEAPPNDLELMKSLLSAGGIEPDRMNILKNPDKVQIQRAFRSLSKRLGPDDSLLFYFSGHGTQIVDKFGTFPGDEAKGRYPDKNDEALLPVDANLASPDTYLLDDELNAMLQDFQTKKITCIIDTCYSGDILKEIRLGRVKGAVTDAPTDIHHQGPALSRTEDILDEAAEFALLLAAAPYNQVVHELRVPIRNDYLSVSAMTYSLYRQVMEGAIPEMDTGAIGMSKLTYRELVQQIQADHQAWNLPWMPVLEGPGDRFDDFFLEGTSFTVRDEMLSLKTITGHSTLLSQSQLISAGGGDFRLGLLHAPKVRHCAIVIGVDAYPPPFQSLKYAADDAKAVKDVFQDDGFMVTLMTPDSLLQPTKENIVRQLERHVQLEDIELLTVGSRFEGVQASDAVNAANNLRGAQLSVVNIANSVIGSQIGVVNIARNVEGLQLGVVNVSESISGTPIGIFNFVKSSPPRLRFWSSDTAIANVGVKLGNRSVYSLLMAGIQPHEDPDRWSFGLGIGGNIPLQERLFLNIDVLSQSIHARGYDWWDREFNLLGGEQTTVRSRLAVQSLVQRRGRCCS